MSLRSQEFYLLNISVINDDVLSTLSERCSKTRRFSQYRTGVPTANETALHFSHCAANKGQF